MIDSETGYLFTNDENLMKKDPGEKEKNAKAFKDFKFFNEFFNFFFVKANESI